MADDGLRAIICVMIAVALFDAILVVFWMRQERKVRERKAILDALRRQA